MFELPEHTSLAQQHWSNVAANTRRRERHQHVHLTCQRLEADLWLKYHHTGEEIQIVPEQLRMLLNKDALILAAAPAQTCS